MRKHILATAMTVALLIAGTGNAVTLDQLVVDADCNGWNADVTVAFRTGAMMARLEYVVLLQDAAGEEMDRFEYSDWITIPSTPTEVFSVGGAWTTVLDGNYELSSDFYVYDIFPDGYNLTGDTVVSALACGDATGGDPPQPRDPCRYRLIYWVRHPDDWPLMSLDIGGATYSQDELMDLMTPRQMWNMTRRLKAQLAVAMLNAANGAENVPANLIQRADDFLLAHQYDARPLRGRERGKAVRLGLKLWFWNRSGCGDGTGPTSNKLGVDQGDDAFWAGLADDKAREEIVNLGSLKSIYR